MSLDPSPLSPQPTPLLHPTDPVPGRGSALVGALISVVLAVVVGVVATRAGTALIFLPQGVGAKAQLVINQLPRIQGFDYYWSKSFTPKKYGYDQADINATNLGNQAHDYHMNLVVITVTANESYLPNTTLSPVIAYDGKNQDTYSDQVYIDLIKAAQKAGLTPVIKLDLRLLGEATHNTASTTVGSLWLNQPGNETAWFNNYTQFAIHYAQMAKANGVPLLILGHNLAYIATDYDSTTQYLDAKGNPAPKPCEGFAKCYGRRDMEWRHMVNAIHSDTYTPLGSKTSLPGGGYSGKLTFAATVLTSANNGSGPFGTPEYQLMTWWDALDIIGVDAFFPLTKGGDVSAAELQDVWEGRDTSPIPVSSENYVDSLKKVHDRFITLPILFTAAGYESTSGANKTPGQADALNGVRDDTEQINDMQALVNTFNGKTWWLGVIWASDYPISPRSAAVDPEVSQTNGIAGLAEPTWSINTQWAGDCLQGAATPCDNPEKNAGQWLRSYYQPAPLPDVFWKSLQHGADS